MEMAGACPVGVSPGLSRLWQPGPQPVADGSTATRQRRQPASPAVANSAEPSATAPRQKLQTHPALPTGTASAGSPLSGNLANGEQIYFRAVDLQGNNIPYSGGPAVGGMMMGPSLTCAACHGSTAQGGQRRLHMQVIDAPPITGSALVKMAQEDAGQSTYTLQDFHNAVVLGQDIDGSPLNGNMPHWQLSGQDLADLFAFLNSIQ